MIVESLRVKNYKVLRDVHITKIPPLAVFVGANGSGKSTVLDVFSFLRDCVWSGLPYAVSKRGGFDELRSQEAEQPISVDLRFRFESGDPVYYYKLEFDTAKGSTFVVHESYGLDGEGKFPVTQLFEVANGRAVLQSPDRDWAISPDDDHASVAFQDRSTLGLTAFGLLQQFDKVSRLRTTIQTWRCLVSDRNGTGGYMELTTPNVQQWDVASSSEFAHFLSEAHRGSFDEVVRTMSREVPGLVNVQPYETEDGRFILRFQDGAFKDPFSESAVSDGTMKLFKTLLMLHEPVPRPLLTTEEPENELYPRLVEVLAEEYRAYAHRGSQVFVSTHSPDFVNALELEEVFWIEKKNGEAKVVHAIDDPNLVSQHAGGELLGRLWSEGLFGRVDVR